MGVVHKFTPARRESFIETLRRTGNVRVSAGAVAVTTSWLYRLRKKDPAFAARWDEAIDEAVAEIALEARRRAVAGWDVPVFHKGRRVGVIRRYSDFLLAVLLRLHRPERFQAPPSGWRGNGLPKGRGRGSTPSDDLIGRLERARARVEANRRQEDA